MCLSLCESQKKKKKPTDLHIESRLRSPATVPAAAAEQKDSRTAKARCPACNEQQPQTIACPCLCPCPCLFLLRLRRNVVFLHPRRRVHRNTASVVVARLWCRALCLRGCRSKGLSSQNRLCWLLSSFSDLVSIRQLMPLKQMLLFATESPLLVFALQKSPSCLH